MKALIVITLLLLQVSTAWARIEAYEFSSQEQEEDYKVLINELRCLVCQNQNLADSNAELAQDLRQQTYEQLQQGKSRGEIVDYMVARYGDFVMYRPPLKTYTLLLWVGPFAILLVVLIVVIRKMSQRQPVAELDTEALKQAKSLLEGDGSDKKPSDQA